MDKETKKAMREFLSNFRDNDTPICNDHNRENCQLCWYWLLRETGYIKESIT